MNKTKTSFLSRKRAITTFLSRKFKITRSSIAYEDFLGSSIASQVMPPWLWVMYFVKYALITIPSRFERGATIRYSLYKQTQESLGEVADLKQVVKVVHMLSINCAKFCQFSFSSSSVSTRWRYQWFPCQPRCRLLYKGKTGEKYIFCLFSS